MDPERIAHFEILERLGAGAMGVVYRARDTLLGREVALKLIRGERAGDRHSRGRFLRECRAAASINHPGIATVYEAGESDGELYLASELIRGESLQTRLSRGRMAPLEVAELGIQLGEALSAAHAQGVVHRDIKPANLMIQADGRLKILDFGLARLLGPEAPGNETATRTRAGMVVGTPAYMSPEQATGSPVDPRTDVFSAGSVLYAATSGREPFLTSSVPETLRRILSEEPQPLESLDPSIPLGLSRVIRKALAQTESPAEATLILNSLVLLRDGSPVAAGAPRGAGGVCARSLPSRWFWGWPRRPRSCTPGSRSRRDSRVGCGCCRHASTPRRWPFTSDRVARVTRSFGFSTASGTPGPGPGRFDRVSIARAAEISSFTLAPSSSPGSLLSPGA